MTSQTTGQRGASALRLALIVTLIAGAAAGCGKRGLPQAPIIRIPTRVDPITARRLGPVVYLQFQIPTVNADRTGPADLSRLEVYGFTGTPVDDPEILKRGMLVASVPVRKPPSDEEGATSEGSGKKKKGGEEPKKVKPAPVRPPASLENGFDQGNIVLVSETLGTVQTTVVPPKVSKKELPPDDSWLPPPFMIKPVAKPVRYYVVVGVSRSGRKGAPSARVAVPIVAAPAPASAVTATYDDKGLKVTWVPPTTARLPIQVAAPKEALESKELGVRSSPSVYNVYEVPTGAATAPPASTPPPVAPKPGAALPVPLNAKALDAPPLADPRLEFGQSRCYVVRTVTVFDGALAVESEPSTPGCVTPKDTFPPQAPKNLSAVASEGSISLIWDANSDADLAGYLVLRSPAASVDFVAITDTVIKETTFRDATVKPGVRYKYVVVAVDTAGNRSQPSNAAEETGR